ncbi:MAG: hypothetical protein PHG20_09750 [Geobacteraceae bacterium]|nr:hypothetical protein [Geobacteraceae bacterium]
MGTRIRVGLNIFPLLTNNITLKKPSPKKKAAPSDPADGNGFHDKNHPIGHIKIITSLRFIRVARKPISFKQLVPNRPSTVQIPIK